MSGKTEPATPRRLKRAREAGDIPFSGALVGAVTLIVGIGLSAALLERARLLLLHLIRESLRAPESIAFLEHAGLEFRTIVPWLSGVALAASVVTLAQIGSGLRFRFWDQPRSKGGVFDVQRLSTTLIGALAALAIGCCGLALLYRYPQSLANSVSNPRALGALLGFFLQRLLWWAAAAALLVGLFDLWMARHAWLARLRMTRSELRAEQKESGNDPDLKAARRRWYQEP